jgi:hypothetical protein
MKPRFGWKPDYPAMERILGESQHPILGLAAEAHSVPHTERTALLYEPIVWRWPAWKQGAQAIGDCVSWGSSLACTAILCKEAMRRNNPRLAPAAAATESIYGGARVEALGKRSGGWSDGAFGLAAAKWVKNWGVLLRLDYSKQTGNPEHDLRKYNPDTPDGKGKAKSWGNWGNGGKEDNGALDALAKHMPVREYSSCRGFEDVGRTIGDLAQPVTIGSGQGFDMTLDRDGFWHPSGSWAHLMVWLGVRYGSRPGALLFQSWGPRTTKKTENKWPKEMPDNVAGCSGWVDADVVDRMCKKGDANALIGMAGFVEDTFDWRHALP